MNLRAHKFYNYNKSQVAGQIFIYIFAVIVVGLLALMGYKVIFGTIEKTCTIKTISFSENIKNYANEYSQYGYYKEEILSVPCNAVEVCFVSSEDIIKKSLTLDTEQIGKYALIKDSVESGVEDNIFLITKDGTKPIGYSEKLQTDGLLCIESKKELRLSFSGLGQKTLVTKTEN